MCNLYNTTTTTEAMQQLRAEWERVNFYLVADEAAFADIDFRKLPAIGPITGYSDADELARWISSIISSAPETLRRSPGALERVLPAMLLDRMSEICRQAGHGTIVHLHQSYAHSLFSRARKRVDDLPDDGLSVAALADELRVPQHVLRQAFIQSTGISPRVWLRQHRLGRARRAMLRPDGQTRTVAQIATEAGFFHLGRFAAYYAETFHETPIETLRAAAGL
jgi:AraC family transcriptional regulator, ethanolamine operon transcriptional activator